MADEARQPFDSLESSFEYMSLLALAVKDAQDSVTDDLAAGSDAGIDRERDAMRLVQLKLSQLTTHVAASRRILNDLRMLHRLLLGGREAKHDGRYEREEADEALFAG